MCKSKNDESKEIESLGIRGLTEIEIQEFEEQISMDKEFREFILEDRSKENRRIGFNDEGFSRICAIDTEENFLIAREESYAEY